MRRRSLLLRGLALVGLVAFLGSGCGGSDDPAYTNPLLVPANAYTGIVPGSAQYVDPATFGALLDAGRLKLLTMDDFEEERQARQAELEEVKQLATALYADRQAVLARHTSAPHDAYADFEALPDGNWAFHVSDDQVVQLSGLAYAYRELVDSTQRFRTKENQLGVYEALHARLDADYLIERNFPDPADVASLTYEKILDLNRTIADDWAAFYPPLTSTRPPGYPQDAAAEEGYGGGTDTAVFPVRTGIADKIDFPLKWYVTSIKDQGRRGTCTAFGVTACVEALVARDRGRWVNLSEQMLFNRAKQIWEGANYGDSYSTAELLGNMLIKNYAYSFESTWDYNLSPRRVKFDYGGFYSYSCWANKAGDPYVGEHCSDTTHQATMLTTGLSNLTFVAFVNPAVDVPADAGFRVLLGHSIADPGILGVTWAIGMLSLKIPVIISVTVPAIGMERKLVTASEGIVTYASFEPEGTGGHCMLLVGFVPNALLPAGVPDAAGMGYFICKNSWGSGYGDGGYTYLPTDWVMRWARGLYTLSAVY